jgi:Rieske Fe-S protein
VSLATVNSLVQACGGSPTSPSSAPPLPTVSGTVASGTVTVTIDPSSPLSPVGGAAFVQSAAASFLVARTGQDSFTALTSLCTHEGCTVSGFENQQYVCPCHGSRYSTAGNVVQGPAPAALTRFNTAFAGNVLTITL